MPVDEFISDREDHIVAIIKDAPRDHLSDRKWI